MIDKKKAAESEQSVLFADWIKSQVGVWEEAVKQASQTWQVPFVADTEAAYKACKQTGPDVTGKVLFDFFAALATIAGTPKPDDFLSVKSVSDLMLMMLRPLWGYSIKLEKQWAEMTGATATGQPEHMAEFIKQLTKSFYEAKGEDLRKILNVPQIGLNRYYQERFNKMIENASAFQSAQTDFLQMLMIPMEKAYYSVQEEIAKLEKEGKAAIEDSRALYQLWIQKLEDHYMELLKSNEYRKTLRETLNTLHDFRAARAEYIMDQMHDLPIPTNRDMDDLSKDLYLLKKRVKELERKEAQRKAEEAARFQTEANARRKTPKVGHRKTKVTVPRKA